jgi:hypothetical protein
MSWINDYEFRVERRSGPDGKEFVSYINKREARRYAEQILENDPSVDCVSIWEHAPPASVDFPEDLSRVHPVARIYRNASTDWP